MELILHVASAVRHFRKQAGLSQEELAALAGLDRTYISGVERGVRNITLASLEAVIAALGVDAQAFFAEAFPRPNGPSEGGAR